jgi:hypothetical protein
MVWSIGSLQDMDYRQNMIVNDALTMAVEFSTGNCPVHTHPMIFLIGGPKSNWTIGRLDWNIWLCSPDLLYSETNFLIRAGIVSKPLIAAVLTSS